MGLHVRLADFFLIFKYGPMLQQSVSVTLLLVAFAFGRPSCSNLGVSPSANSSGRPS